MSDQRVAAEHEVLLHLEGVRGPVGSSDLVAAATRSGAPPHVIATLERLPDRTWTSIEEAAAAIGTGRQTRDQAQAVSNSDDDDTN
jgi:hypothetical protein